MYILVIISIFFSAAMQEQEKEWPCFECNQRFSTSVDLQKHLNQHDEENDVIGGPRIRPKARARAKFTKKGHSARLRVTLILVLKLLKVL